MRDTPRVMDIDLNYGPITTGAGKGRKDRVTPQPPASLNPRQGCQCFAGYNRPRLPESAARSRPQKNAIQACTLLEKRLFSVHSPAPFVRQYPIFCEY